MKHYSMLCLGDSYTIGEGVSLHDSFPYQAVQILRNVQHHFYAPEIVAKTGWTTFELAEHLLHIKLSEHYDFVTLLIGVNNQYRGLTFHDFKEELIFLVRKALHYAQQVAGHVMMLSIPDWSMTPFAKGKDAKKIASEIDAFNAICENVAKASGIHFIDITRNQRLHAADPEFLAPDQLHPSGREYAKWAERLVEIINYKL